MANNRQIRDAMIVYLVVASGVIVLAPSAVALVVSLLAAVLGAF